MINVIDNLWFEWYVFEMIIYFVCFTVEFFIRIYYYMKEETFVFIYYILFGISLYHSKIKKLHYNLQVDFIGYLMKIWYI